MKMTNDQIQSLLGSVAKTSGSEVSCQTCEDHIAQFAESELSGKGIPEALQAIEKHFKVCPECSEELEYIRRALQDENSGSVET